jgi:hypothetical protein
LLDGVVGSSVRRVHCGNNEPPILTHGIINRAANNETREDILHSDSHGVIAMVKGFRLLDAGFFYQMTNIIESNRTAEQEAEASWEFEDRIFRPLTPEAIARQLREMQTRWFNRNDRDFDLEDEYEQWMMEVLIVAIEEGGLKLK